ncbi:hypothetical protein WME89_49765 [Sorangium sp. So ce321]|uniref:hypothetical protein n=1 Tax=Sorangium sp. So ce321 TaxID=3133300 RepID=UPI003F5F9AD8
MYGVAALPIALVKNEARWIGNGVNERAPFRGDGKHTIRGRQGRTFCFGWLIISYAICCLLEDDIRATIELRVPGGLSWIDLPMLPRTT